MGTVKEARGEEKHSGNAGDGLIPEAISDQPRAMGFVLQLWRATEGSLHLGEAFIGQRSDLSQDPEDAWVAHLFG